MDYDSERDTRKHIDRVLILTSELIGTAIEQIDKHDQSKLEQPEKALFDEFTPKLKGLTYNSEEYKAILAELKVALDHHYLYNSHHPEHNQSGVAGMTLIDLIEMFCDWKAATERHADGNFANSILKNKDRFCMDPQLVSIFENTRVAMKW